MAAAIEWQAGEFENRSGITCVLHILSENIYIPEDFTTALFRIFQETLTNVARHAEAKRVTVYLKKIKNSIKLTVKDDGKGITKEQIDSSKSFGLIGMRERVYFMGGRINIKGSPNDGTTVSVEVPYKPGRGETC